LPRRIHDTELKQERQTPPYSIFADIRGSACAE
jgi:hypothetical protein